LRLSGNAYEGIGNSGNNVIEGNDRSNRLEGGAGLDTLIGGAGDDLYIYDGQDSIQEADNASGGQWDQVESSVSITTLMAGIENITLTGSAAINARGSSGANQIQGNTASNVIHGGQGNDRLWGGGGADIYRFEAGDGVDSISDYSDGQGINRIQIADQEASYRFTSNGWAFQVEQISTLPAPLNAISFEWDWWNVENQSFEVQFTDALWNPSRTFSSAEMEARYVAPTGTQGDDALIGTLGSDLMQGGNGYDHLIGRSGDDVLDGGADYDQLEGGLGLDTYLINGLGQGIDTVYADGLDTVRFNGIELGGLDIRRVVWDANAFDGPTWNYGAGTGLFISTSGWSSGVVVPYMFTEAGLISQGIASLTAGSGANFATLNFDQLRSRVTGVETIGNDLLTRFSQSDVVNALGGDDEIFGGGGADQLYGNAGNDLIVGSGFLDGGSGDDRIVFNTVSAGNDIAQGGEGNDRLEVQVGTGQRILRGGIGNDEISIADYQSTSPFNNNYYGALGANIVEYARGDGRDTVAFYDSQDNDIIRFVDVELSDLQFSRRLSGGFFIGVSGSPEDSGILITNPFGWGYGGIPTSINLEVRSDSGAGWVPVSTQAINEGLLAGSDGADYINGTSGADEIRGRNGNDLLFGGEGNDKLYGDNGDDSAYGEGGDDVLEGGEGEDFLFGGNGADKLRGGYGNDSYLTYDEADELTEGLNQGRDHVTYGGTGTLTLAANIEDGSVTGGGILLGNDLDNELTSQNGLVDGGAGSDTLKASGLNPAQFGFARGGGQDTIQTDKLVDENPYAEMPGLDSLDFDASIAFDQLWFEQLSTDLKVSVIGGGGSVTIQDWFAQTSTRNTRVEVIRSGDGWTLDDTRVADLAQAMAAFSIPTDMTLPPPIAEVLVPTLTASWQ
jgi:Ca2+-binding RTX toxin-like protein